MEPKISKISLGKSYPYNPITERFEGEKREKRAWVNDFYKSIGYSLFLSKQENDTSLRQGYILLDNVVEQFLKSYLRNVEKIKFDYTDFQDHASLAHVYSLLGKYDKALSHYNEALIMSKQRRCCMNRPGT